MPTIQKSDKLLEALKQANEIKALKDLRKKCLHLKPHPDTVISTLNTTLEWGLTSLKSDGWITGGYIGHGSQHVGSYVFLNMTEEEAISVIQSALPEKEKAPTKNGTLILMTQNKVKVLYDMIQSQTETITNHWAFKNLSVSEIPQVGVFETKEGFRNVVKEFHKYRWVFATRGRPYQMLNEIEEFLDRPDITDEHVKAAADKFTIKMVHEA